MPPAIESYMQAQKEDTLRAQLFPAEKNNAVTSGNTRKSEVREVVSRYKSGISSTPKRSHSPNYCQVAPSPAELVSKRAQSADRRRPSSPSSPTSKHSAPSSPSRPSTPSSPSSRSNTPVRHLSTEVQGNSRKLRGGGRVADGLWPSMRNLTSSFQSDPGSVTFVRDKPVRFPSPVGSLKTVRNLGSERKATPPKGRSTSEQLEDSRLVERLPSGVVEQHRSSGGRSAMNSLVKNFDLTERFKKSASLHARSIGISPERVSVTESASASLLQQPNSVIRRTLSDACRKNEHKMHQVPHGPSNPTERSTLVVRPGRSQSPTPALHRSSSPVKMVPTSSSIQCTMQSPTRSRPSTSLSSPTRRTGVPLDLNYTTDAQMGKRPQGNHIQDAHQLRLLFNKNLQWCFINSLSDAISVIQEITAERDLLALWAMTSKLRDSVIVKRMKLQQLKQEMKLNVVLNGYNAYLEDWASVEMDHSSSLFGAVESLKACTLLLPVTEGARVDVRSMKNAFSSAVDVMQAMSFSIRYLLSKSEGMIPLISELSYVVAEEVAMLDECRDLLALTGTMQVQEASLRSHLLQLRREL